MNCINTSLDIDCEAINNSRKQLYKKIEELSNINLDLFIFREYILSLGSFESLSCIENDSFNSKGEVINGRIIGNFTYKLEYRVLPDLKTIRVVCFGEIKK